MIPTTTEAAGGPDSVVGASGSSPPSSFLQFSTVGRASGGSYVLGTLLIVLAWIFVGGALTLAITVAGMVSSGSLTDSLANGDPLALAADLPIAPWVLVAATLASIVPLGIAVLVVVRYVHLRPWRSVITPFRRISIALIAKGALLWLLPLVLVAVAAVLVGLDSVRWNYQPGAFWPLAAVVLLLTFFQTTSEELFFRGYLSQWLALRGPRIWLISLANAALFGAVHLANPLLAGYRGGDYLVSIVPYFVIGFVWAWVSCTSGTIELAIGAHFVNNMVAFLLISPPELGVDSGGLFVVESTSAWSSTVTAVAVALVFWLLVRRIRATGVAAPLQPVRTTSSPRPGAGSLPAQASGPPMQPTAGWYPDPAGRGWRYWSGTHWTHHRSP